MEQDKPREECLRDVCTQAVKEYVSILTQQAKCGERGWRVETRTREQGEMGEDYDLLCNCYSASSVEALGHEYDHIKIEALDLQTHVIKVPSSFRLTMCTENQCPQCQIATQIRQAEDPTWSVSRVLAPLASNLYKDDGCPSFLEHVRAGTPQLHVKNSTKKKKPRTHPAVHSQRVQVREQHICRAQTSCTDAPLQGTFTNSARKEDAFQDRHPGHLFQS